MAEESIRLIQGCYLLLLLLSIHFTTCIVQSVCVVIMTYNL